ncbi:MAG: EipA family protein [Pseudomonadota bacterium]
MTRPAFPRNGLFAPISVLLYALLCDVLLAGCATPANDPTSAADIRTAQGLGEPGAQTDAQTYEQSELVAAISTHLGVTSESAATAIERLFRERGKPVGYITGEEGGGALTVGARFGKGTLWMKDGTNRELYWQGPTIGFDAGGEASKVFTLVYGLTRVDDIYRRFPGVDGSAFLVGGMAVNYQRTNDITLAPVRTGVGVRLGANVGYTRYTKRRALPF